jgi:hypothetical protein
MKQKIRKFLLGENKYYVKIDKFLVLSSHHWIEDMITKKARNKLYAYDDYFADIARARLEALAFSGDRSSIKFEWKDYGKSIEEGYLYCELLRRDKQTELPHESIVLDKIFPNNKRESNIKLDELGHFLFKKYYDVDYKDYYMELKNNYEKPERATYWCFQADILFKIEYFLKDLDNYSNLSEFYSFLFLPEIYGLCFSEECFFDDLDIESVEDVNIKNIGKKHYYSFQQGLPKFDCLGGYSSKNFRTKIFLRKKKSLFPKKVANNFRDYFSTPQKFNFSLKLSVNKKDKRGLMSPAYNHKLSTNITSISLKKAMNK